MLDEAAKDVTAPAVAELPPPPPSPLLGGPEKEFRTRGVFGLLLPPTLPLPPKLPRGLAEDNVDNANEPREPCRVSLVAGDGGAATDRRVSRGVEPALEGVEPGVEQAWGGKGGGDISYLAYLRQAYYACHTTERCYDHTIL